MIPVYHQALNPWWAGAACSRKAWRTDPPTLISAVSFYIHHVSIICLYGNRLGSRPNALSPPFAVSLIVIGLEDFSEMSVEGPGEEREAAAGAPVGGAFQGWLRSRCCVAGLSFTDTGLALCSSVLADTPLRTE